MDLGLKDRVYIVTGGTRGLDLAAVRELTFGEPRPGAAAGRRPRGGTGGPE